MSPELVNSCGVPPGQGMMEQKKKPLLWCVVYTKPRSEKKFARYCDDHFLSYELPTYKSVRKYPRKKVIFYKPYFPGYVFVHTIEDNYKVIRGSQHLHSLLKVIDQELFVKQLCNVLTAINSGIKLLPVPEVKAGVKVKIRSGPMQGVEGVVERRQGICKVYLTLDFIGQGIAATMDADKLEVIG